MIENEPKKLILGLLSNVSLENAQPFFLSLVKSGYRGDVCMIISGLDSATQAFLRARRVQLIPFQRDQLKSRWTRAAAWLGACMQPEQRLIFEGRLASTYMHPHTARHFFYQSYLRECGAAYSHVLLTDVRDVLFQDDPFAFDVPDGLCVFLADRSKTIGTCNHNTGSMLRGFGQKVLNELRDKPIACAGTTLGTTAAISEHLAKVTRLLCARKQRESIDQSVHNFVINKQPPARLNVFENFSGPVLTMAYVDPARLSFDDRGRITGTGGRIINVLHQYDRHPQLAPELVRRLT